MSAYYSSDSDLEILDMTNANQYNHLPVARAAHYQVAPYRGAQQQPHQPTQGLKRSKYFVPEQEPEYYEDEPGYVPQPSHKRVRYVDDVQPVSKRLKPSTQGAYVEEVDDVMPLTRVVPSVRERSIGNYVDLFQPGTTSIVQPPSTQKTFALVSNNANNFFGGQLKPGQRITASMNSKGQLVTRCTQMEGRRAVCSQVTTYGSAGSRTPAQTPRSPPRAYRH